MYSRHGRPRWYRNRRRECNRACRRPPPGGRGHGRRRQGRRSGCGSQGRPWPRHVRGIGDAVRREACEAPQQVLEAGRRPGAPSLDPEVGQAGGCRHHAERRQGDDGADRSAHRCQPSARGGLGDLRLGKKGGTYPGHQSCRGVDRNPTTSCESVLSDSEVPKFWTGFDSAGLVAGTALKIILLTGQRPGEVAHMRREHIRDGWWEMPGRSGSGARLARHQERRDASYLAPRSGSGINRRTERRHRQRLRLRWRARQADWQPRPAMRAICKEISAERATPHDCGARTAPPLPRSALAATP